MMGWFEAPGMARNFELSILSPLFSGSTPGFLSALQERLKNFRILEEVGDQGLRRLLSAADWFGLPGGSQLMRDGENDRAVFLVVTGSLGVFVEGDEGSKRLVATIPAGETVGEMSLLTGESHSATLVALRDTELLRIGPKAFDGLITRHPRLMFNLLKIVVRRLRETTRGAQQRARPKTFAMVPLQRGLTEVAAVRSMADALVKMGAKAAVLDSKASSETTEWFNRFEAEHDIIFYHGDQPDSAWTNLCLRQADRIMLIARADESIPLHPFERRYFQRELTATPELLLVHSEGQTRGGLPRHIEFRSDLFGTHHHVRAGNIEDIKRLARFIAGSAVNIVLAGGGARGFAHIGVLKALRDAGVPFDCVAGTSMGGIIAAGIAMEWDLEELTERVRELVCHQPAAFRFYATAYRTVPRRESDRFAAKAFWRCQDRGFAKAVFLRLVRSDDRSRLRASFRAAVAGVARERRGSRYSAAGFRRRAPAGRWRGHEQFARRHHGRRCARSDHRRGYFR